MNAHCTFDLASKECLFQCRFTHYSRPQGGNLLVVRSRTFCESVAGQFTLPATSREDPGATLPGLARPFRWTVIRPCDNSPRLRSSMGLSRSGGLVFAAGCQCVARSPRRVSKGTHGPAPPTHQTIRPEMRQGYPLNLSILISGGKETNKDSLSNGE